LDERIVPNADPIALDVFASAHAGTVVQLSADASDPDFDQTNITSISTPINGTVTYNNNDVVFTPNIGFVGTEVLTYTVGDGNGGFANALMTFELTNTAPVVINYDVYAHAGNSASVIPVFTDTDNGDTPTITAVGSSPNGTVSLNAGEITFTPNAGFVGMATIEYTVNDGYSNGDSIGTISFHMVNLPPTAGNYEFTAHAGNTIVIALDLFTDPDDDDVSVSELGIPFYGNASVDAFGLVTYTPTTPFVGTESFTYTLTDGFWNGSSVGNIIIHFTNTAPTANDLYLSTTRGVALIGNVLTAATDADGDILSAVPATFTSANGGSVVINADGSFSYTASSTFLGIDSFEFTVEDGYDGEDVGTVTVEVTDEYGNLTEPPVAYDVLVEVYTDETMGIPIGSHNIDVYGGAINLHSISYDADNIMTGSNGTLVTEHGSVSIDEYGFIIYTPSSSIYEGTDQFIYRVVNSLGAVSAPKTVTVYILAPIPAEPKVPYVEIDFSTVATKLVDTVMMIPRNERITVRIETVRGQYEHTITLDEDTTPAVLAQKFLMISNRK